MELIGRLGMVVAISLVLTLLLLVLYQDDGAQAMEAASTTSTAQSMTVSPERTSP